MSILRLLNQTLVYWAPGSEDRYANTSWEDPVEISGRWEEKAELFLDETGEKTLSRAVAYLDGSTSIVMDGRLMLGTLLSLSSSPDPATDGGLRISSIGDAPSINAQTSLKKVMLV